MKEEQTIYLYVPDWEPVGTVCYDAVTNKTENYYG